MRHARRRLLPRLAPRRPRHALPPSHEVGILYVTLMVHEGWGDPGAAQASRHDAHSSTPMPPAYRASSTCRSSERQRPRRQRARGGDRRLHARRVHHPELVGPGWGAGGFALLPYEDYLLHATDVWVAQLGVPVRVDLWQQGARRHHRGPPARHPRHPAGRDPPLRRRRRQQRRALDHRRLLDHQRRPRSPVRRARSRRRPRAGRRSASCSTCTAA